MRIGSNRILAVWLFATAIIIITTIYIRSNRRPPSVAKKIIPVCDGGNFEYDITRFMANNYQYDDYVKRHLAVDMLNLNRESAANNTNNTSDEHDGYKRRKSFAIISMYFSNPATTSADLEVTRTSVLSKMLYTNKHAYAFYWYHDMSLMSKGNSTLRASKWTTIPYYMQHYDWVMWTDADAIIMNSSITIESLVDENYDFIVARDYNGLNNGVFLIKSCPLMFQFMALLKSQQEKYVGTLNPDQTCMTQHLAQHPYNTRVKFVHQRTINAYASGKGPIPYQFQSGDFILHMPGWTASERLQMLEKMYAKDAFSSYVLPGWSFNFTLRDNSSLW